MAKNAAMLAGTAAYGLQTATSGLLQSPNFLYRVETNKVDSSNGRLKYDGLSMANRLSYLLTGGPPSAALLDAAASGQLDTADGVRAAAAPLLMNAGIADRMTAFFSEYAQAQQVLVVAKSTTMFPTFNEALKSSMLQGLQLFLKNVVLAPNADVRSFYDSDQTYVDAKLAPLYGVQAPASGFGKVKLPASSGRAGILGQAGLIAAQSQSDRTSPTRRGIFILESMLCTTPPPPPAGVNTSIHCRSDAHGASTTGASSREYRSAPDATRCSIPSGSRSSISTPSDGIGKPRTGWPLMPLEAWVACPSTAKRSSAQRCGKSRGRYPA